jgi:hypothetical protein
LLVTQQLINNISASGFVSATMYLLDRTQAALFAVLLVGLQSASNAIASQTAATANALNTANS